jgi:hypothetical protein
VLYLLQLGFAFVLFLAEFGLEGIQLLLFSIPPRFEAADFGVFLLDLLSQFGHVRLQSCDTFVELFVFVIALG